MSGGRQVIIARCESCPFVVVCGQKCVKYRGKTYYPVDSLPYRAPAVVAGIADFCRDIGNMCVVSVKRDDGWMEYLETDDYFILGGILKQRAEAQRRSREMAAFARTGTKTTISWPAVRVPPIVRPADMVTVVAPPTIGLDDLLPLGEVLSRRRNNL